VKSALTKKFPYTTVRIDRPAVVVEFGGGDEMWEVIPGFLTSRGGPDQLVYDIPGPSTGWIDTAPKEHLKYVNESNQAPRDGCAKALSRLVKAWKYYCKVPISSFYLEMRAAQHVRAVSAYVHLWDLCELRSELLDHGGAGSGHAERRWEPGFQRWFCRCSGCCGGSFICPGWVVTPLV
jgi:hypothetical protein